MSEVAGVQKCGLAVARTSKDLELSAGGRTNLPVVARDDLGREVYSILGLPIDAIEMPAALRRIEDAAAANTPLVIATPNINFLVNSQTDREFRASLLFSDLCPIDGMPIVWIARLLGIPIKNRVAGSDIFEALKARPQSKRPVKIFLFGATEQIAAAASEKINRLDGGVRCVGWACPPFGDLDQISKSHFIDQINASGAEFLIVALGAKKGQLWLFRNRRLLRIPVRAHLGAVINFEAGTIERAPLIMQRLGIEWLWRIKEEPALIGRYWQDGKTLLRLLLTQILPLAYAERRLRAVDSHDFVMVETQNALTVTLRLSGHATARQVATATASFRSAFESGKQITVECSELRAIDARFFGLLLMLRKQSMVRNSGLCFTGVSRDMARQFLRNGLEDVFPCGGE